MGGCILLYDLAGDIGGEASFDDIVGGCILLYGPAEDNIGGFFDGVVWRLFPALRPRRAGSPKGVRDSGATCYRSF